MIEAELVLPGPLADASRSWTLVSKIANHNPAPPVLLRNAVHTMDIHITEAIDHA